MGARPTPREPSGSPGQCLAVHASEVQTARAGLPPCDSDNERPAAPQRRSRANVMFARECKKVVGTLAPTGLSLQGVPLPVHRDAAGIERAGAELFSFKLERPRPPLPGGGTPSCLSLIENFDLGEPPRWQCEENEPQSRRGRRGLAQARKRKNSLPRQVSDALHCDRRNEAQARSQSKQRTRRYAGATAGLCSSVTCRHRPAEEASGGQTLLGKPAVARGLRRET